MTRRETAPDWLCHWCLTPSLELCKDPFSSGDYRVIGIVFPGHQPLQKERVARQGLPLCRPTHPPFSQLSFPFVEAIPRLAGVPRLRVSLVISGSRAAWRMRPPVRVCQSEVRRVPDPDGLHHAANTTKQIPSTPPIRCEETRCPCHPFLGSLQPLPNYRRDAGKQGRTGDGIPPRVVDGVEEGRPEDGAAPGSGAPATQTSKQLGTYPSHHPQTSTPNVMPPARPHVCWSDITNKRGAPTCARLSRALFPRCSSSIITVG